MECEFLSFYGPAENIGNIKLFKWTTVVAITLLWRHMSVMLYETGQAVRMNN